MTSCNHVFCILPSFHGAYQTLQRKNKSAPVETTCLFSLTSEGLHTSSTSTTNWKLCCLCQHSTTEKLLNATSSGYLTLASNIPQFYKINCMPIPLDPNTLDDGDEIQLTLEKNNATYHKSCKLKFQTSKLERKRKSVSTSEEKCEVPSAKFIRSSLNKICTTVDSEKKGECFICNQTDTTMNLHQAAAKQA